MAKVIFSSDFEDEINKKFGGESVKIFELLYSLEENPKREKVLGNVAGFVVKELKYKSFRFYFITDGFKLKCLGEEDLVDLLIRFVRMSDKKSQQKTIDEIKNILRIIGPKGFE